MVIGLVRDAMRMLATRRMSRRALAAAFKLRGRRLERRWPFVPRAEGAALNLAFADVLAYQQARSPSPVVVVIGAFDGITNDPVAGFVRGAAGRAIFVEPQPQAFAHLQANFDGRGVDLVNAAIDAISGKRTMYYVPAGAEGMPPWTQQLASFHEQHLLSHEDRAPGIAAHVARMEVPTISFADLLDRFALERIDVLQIDAEGADAQLLRWFPFDRLRPAVLLYESAHMSAGDLDATRAMLRARGYRVLPAESGTDDMAVRL